MPYRRSGARYTRRRPRRKTFWIRNYQTQGAQLDSGTMWVVDTLAPAHFGDEMMRMGGAEQRIDTIGCTILRAHITFRVSWQSAAGPIDWSDHQWYGVAVANWSNASGEYQATIPTTAPVMEYDPYLGANRADWSAWGVCTPDQSPYVVTVATLNHAPVRLDLDMRAKRRLDDPGDTLAFFTTYSGSGAGPNAMDVISSVLLARP